jgi:hypothetical protein
MRANYIIGNFEGVKTFLTPKLQFKVKKDKASLKNLEKSPIMCFQNIM